MRELGIWGVKRSLRVRTTKRDDNADRSPDLVDRDFTADRPNALWVTDLTTSPHGPGVAYVCFIVDAFSRRIVGWRVASHMRTDMVLDALEMARWSRGHDPRRTDRTFRPRLRGWIQLVEATPRDGGVGWAGQLGG